MSGKSGVNNVFPVEAYRTKRRYLPRPVRWLIIASWGMLVAIGTFYLLRSIGY